MTASLAAPKPTFMRGVSNLTAVEEIVSPCEFVVSDVGSLAIGLIARTSSSGGDAENEMLGKITAVSASTKTVTVTHNSSMVKVGSRLWSPSFFIQTNCYPEMPVRPVIPEFPDVIDEGMGGYYNRNRLFMVRRLFSLSFNRINETTKNDIRIWYGAQSAADGSLNEFDLCYDTVATIYTGRFASAPEDFVEHAPGPTYRATLNFIVTKVLI